MWRMRSGSLTAGIQRRQPEVSGGPSFTAPRLTVARVEGGPGWQCVRGRRDAGVISRLASRSHDDGDLGSSAAQTWGSA